ncbi:60S ribosomal protein L2, mitochondrial [Capsicum annuum]|uniref:60S ribosomal protein L2, mitochondrial n=1 Tax=Capsicum annuum TaxID=4072 RepID=A0A2G2YKS3_CAPAN|nr:60S ribosomal protein L2, mitochondrial [Capsicum annuum]
MPSWSKSPFYTSKDVGSKETYAKDVFFSALSSPKAKGETASLSFGSSFGFPRIAVAGAKPAFFSPQMKEKVRGKNTFSLCEIQKWRTHSILWVHRIKHKAALSWQSFRWQETLGLVGASERNESKSKMDQGSLPTKPIGKVLKDEMCKVDRAPVV